MDEYPDIFPDYVGITIPANMAQNEAELFHFEMSDGRCFKFEKKQENNVVWITVCAWKENEQKGIQYKPFPIYISSDTIDPYVAYRLIEPGYESWNHISICQRELCSFSEEAIITNQTNDKGCINCHQFANGNPEKFLFHARVNKAGTWLNDNHQLKKVDIKSLSNGKQATYPAWHPSGKYVAFSSNNTKQCFMMKGKQPIEVYDTASDIILWDIEHNCIVADICLNTELVWETFPTWNADGSKLYYCAADSVKKMPDDRGRVHYRLMSIDFNAEKGCFEGQPTEVPIDTPNMQQHSVSHPRLYQNYLLFTLTDFGTFPIWHKEADLWLLDLKTGKAEPCTTLNSKEADSYHNWSTNGKWIVFGSRRLDGRYTRLFFSHFDGKGNFTKPFLLPQDDVKDNQLRLQSYNIPEFIRGKVSPLNSLPEK